MFTYFDYTLVRLFMDVLFMPPMEVAEREKDDGGGWIEYLILSWEQHVLDVCGTGKRPLS